MRTSILIFFGCWLTSSLYAQDFPSRMKQAYLETDHNFDIDCRYAFNNKFKLITPISETIKGVDFIQRDFLLENETITSKMTFTLRQQGRIFHYTVLFDNKFISQGQLTKREFYLAPVNDVGFSKEFETKQITCGVNFAYAYPHELADGNYHLNVHPHKIYDWQSRLKAPIEKYLNNPDFQSVILLETGNYRGNLVNIGDFLNGREYKLPQVNYPSDLEKVAQEVPLVVSPAGHNRYDFLAQKEINITFTGGNHNYCIWNNTREILEAFMRSKSKARVNIFYDTQSIVAQAKGMEGFQFNFPKQDINRSNLLKHLFENQKNTLNYHTSYHRYFKGIFFKEFLGMFKTVKLSYQAQGYLKTDLLQGQGERELEINLIYL